MRRRLQSFFLLFLALLATAVGAQPVNQVPLVLTGARLFVGDGEVVEQGALLIVDGVIQQAGAADAVDVPAGARVEDLSGMTIMPALVDGHAHLGYQGRQDWGAQNYGVANLIDNLQQYAYYGFAAVFSAGSDPVALAEEVQDRRLAGEYLGARMLYAAGMAPPGQGPNNQFLAEALAVERSSGSTILRGLENPQQARAAVRQVAGEGIDFIKIWVDDRGGSQQKLAPEIYRSVIAEARRHDIRVLAHQQFAADMPGLLDAGVHGFLHGRLGADLDQALARQTRASGAFIVPNLGLGELRREAIGADDFLASILSDQAAAALRGGNRQVRPALDADDERALRRSMADLLDAGVDIVLGTDAGAVPGHPFGYTGHREMEIYVRLGMSPSQALQAGTRVAAAHLGLERQGVLAPGYSADLLVLADNPLADIRHTRSIQRVYLGGIELDRAALRRSWVGP